MVTKYQVFVSSTYQDLKSERDQVIRAVLEMGHIPVGMEMFSAADEEQWQIISRHIEESDYYAVILAHRYGSRIDNISYSRKEYEYAVSCGIPALGFIVDDSAAWPADRIDKSTEDIVLLNDFKALVKQKPVSFWTSADDLYGKFSVALMKAITANPREGWVRASTAAGPEVTAEITRLSAENAKLRAALGQAARESATNREAELSRVNARLESHKVEFGYRYDTGDRSWLTSKKISFRFLFDLLAPMLLAEASVTDISTHLFLYFNDDDKRRAGVVAHNYIRDLLADWNALDLVVPSDRKRSLRDTEEYWTLTPFGRDLQRWRRRGVLMSEDQEVREGNETKIVGDEDKVSKTAKRTTTAKKATPSKKASTSA